MEWEAPEQEEMQQDGGNFLSQPGIYHAIITAVYEELAPPKRDGTQKPIEGFSAAFDILAGTVAGQEGKTINLTFFNGKLNSKDQGKFARKKQAAFLIASNVITPADLGQKIKIDLAKANGQQVVMKLEKDDENSTSDKTYLQLSYADIWHVDDPRCAAHPKKQEALTLIPPEHRRDAKYFESLVRTSNGSSSNGSAAPKRPAVNVDDL